MGGDPDVDEDTSNASDADEISKDIILKVSETTGGENLEAAGKYIGSDVHYVADGGSVTFDGVTIQDGQTVEGTPDNPFEIKFDEDFGQGSFEIMEVDEDGNLKATHKITEVTADEQKGTAADVKLGHQLGMGITGGISLLGGLCALPGLSRWLTGRKPGRRRLVTMKRLLQDISKT